MPLAVRALVWGFDMAIAIEGEMDPSEVLDFDFDFASAPNPVLAEGETIASYSLATTAEAAAHGLRIMSSGSYVPALTSADTVIRLWLDVDPLEVDNAAFAEGISLGIEATIVTDSTPARTRQRTFEVTVKQL